MAFKLLSPTTWLCQLSHSSVGRNDRVLEWISLSDKWERQYIDSISGQGQVYCSTTVQPSYETDLKKKIVCVQVGGLVK